MTTTAKPVPVPRNTMSVRLRTDTVEDMGRAVRRGEAADRNTWITQVTEAALGYVRCPRGTCPDRTPPVPVEFGDLHGRTFGEAAAEAARTVREQHPRHEPVRVGAVSPSGAPGAVFRAPAVTR